APICARGVMAEVWFPGERPGADGHLLRTKHRPRRRWYPAAGLGHAATSRAALPGGSCWYRLRARRRRRQWHAGLAESPCQSSVFPYLSIVKIASEFRDTQPLRQASSHRDAMCRQASVSTATRRRCRMPAEGHRTPGSWYSGAPEKVNYRPRKITEAAAEWFA